MAALTRARARAIAIFFTFALVTPGIGIAPALADDITITSAEISAGKLQVSGKTAVGGVQVKLDNNFVTTSNAVTKNFSFKLAYFPPDCMVELAMVPSAAPPTQVVVADCGQRGVNPRGPWTRDDSYIVNDLVTLDGSTWRAKLDSTNIRPGGIHTNTWEKFVSKGDPGAPGAPGATGSKGMKGDPGAPGAPGPTGSKGMKGDPGAPGAPGATGAKGMKGDPGAPGVNGDAGAAGADGQTGAQGQIGPQGPSGTVQALQTQSNSYPAITNIFADACAVTITPTGGKVMITGQVALAAYNLDFLSYTIFSLIGATRTNIVYAKTGNSSLGYSTGAVANGWHYSMTPFVWIDEPAAGVAVQYSVALGSYLYNYSSATGATCVINAVELKP